MSHYLLIDFGSTFTKLTAVDLELEDIIGTSKAFTTVETNIVDGFDLALERLYATLGKDITFDHILACSSAAGGLKMAALGLVESLTTEAARRVCLGAGAKVELVISNNMNRQEVQSIIDKNIDIILLAGGANGGNTSCVIHNAKMLAKSDVKAPIVYAGNKDAIDDISDILTEGQKTFFICENVMPKLNSLNIQSAQNQIKKIFVENIIEAKGIKRIEERVGQVILPTPNAVLMAAELLSLGYGNEKGLGDLMLADVGGATTDMYSMSKGLPTHSNAILTGLEEPYAKRTVEGDLGMRYSALGVYTTMSSQEISNLKNEGIDIEAECKKRNSLVDLIPNGATDEKVEHIIGSKCIEVATSRHVGTIKSIYTPLGTMYDQVGKDLTKTNYLIGTGGVVISSKDPVSMLKHATSLEHKPMELRPKHPVYLLDKDYILSAMGLLSMKHPEIALKIMKKRIIKL